MEHLIILAFGVLSFGTLGLINWWQHRGPTLTGPATVVSRRVELGRGSSRYSGGNWNYYVTFRLLDGEELELSTLRYHFETLNKGMTGQLTWCRDHLCDFEEDCAV